MYRQQLPGTDWKKSLRLVPKAGNNPVAQVSPPPPPPSRRLKRRTKSPDLGIPDGETPRERGDPREATTEGHEDSLETTPQEPKDPIDPKSSEGRSGTTSSAGGPLEPDVTERTTSPAATATSWQEARRSAEICRQLTAAWRPDLVMEKPQKSAR